MITIKTYSSFYFQNILFACLFAKISSVLHHLEPRTIIYPPFLSENKHNLTDLSYPFNAGIKYVWKKELPLDLNQTLSATAEDLKKSNNTVCYQDLGCITRFSFADPILWPINVLPEAREKINTHFTLYTREQPYDAQSFVKISANDPIGIITKSFNATRPTKFYIHGWHASGYEDRHKTFVDRLLGSNDVNAVYVHWGGGANTSYDQGHANARLVGLEVAFLVNTMTDKLGVNATDVHLIGHSLGAHIAGYAGEKILNLGRITGVVYFASNKNLSIGLDPAGPYFRGMPSFASLDPSDANFVDAIHTDGDFLGIYEPVGHLDFYPNGGKSQPGCDPANWPSNANDSIFSCNHARAIYLFSESLIESQSCQSVGYECSNYESFNKGECSSCGTDNNQCTRFGLKANVFPIGSRTNVKLYFNTGQSFPFCRYHYSVNVNLAEPHQAKEKINGKLQISVYGDNGMLSYINLPLTYLEHGKENHFLLTAPSSLGRVIKVNLRWKFVITNLLEVTCFLGLCNQRLYVNNVIISELNNYPEEERIANTFTNCPQSAPGVIRSYSSLDFTTENCCKTAFRNFILLDFVWVPDFWSVYYYVFGNNSSVIAYI